MNLGAGARSPHPPAVRDDAAMDTRETRAAICTLDVDDWLTSCRSGALRSPSCAVLEDPATTGVGQLSLQLESRPQLRELVFRSGPWAQRSVAELERAVMEGLDAEEQIAIDAVSLAFLDCVDRGVLARPTTTPICPTAGGGMANGLEGARCASLDGSCQRGFFDEMRGCCDARVSVVGASCELEDATSAACSDAGRCDSTVERASYNPYAWSELLPAEDALVRVGDWYLADEAGNATHAVLRLSAARDAGADVHDAEAVDERAVLRVPVANSERVSVAVLDAEESGVAGVLLHTERAGPRTLLIEVSTAPDSVAITRAPVDGLFFLGADGTSLPDGQVEVVPCVGTFDSEAPPSEELRCGMTPEGLLAVEGQGLTGAFLVQPGLLHEIRPAGRLRPQVEPAERLVPGDLVRDRRYCPREWRSCETSCGSTGVQFCSGAGIWSVCRATERCNAGDDDCDGRVDESGNALCNDGLSCTVDRCVRQFRPRPPYVTAQCENTPSPAVCRRGRCTRGICNGVRDVVGGGPVSWVSPTFGSGCSYEESDAACEIGWDGCVCNGRARCQGALGPQWNGFNGSTGTIVDGLAPNQSALDNSQASCRDRQPQEPLVVGGPNIVNGNLVRNGGCESNSNPCSIDGVCCEPNPEGCRMFHEGGSLANPVDPFAVADLGAICGLESPLVQRRTARLDGSLPYQCVTSIGDVSVPPTGTALRSFCRPDGNPCTPQPLCQWDTSRVGGPLLFCQPPPFPVGEVATGEAFNFYWDGLAIAQDVGPSCAGDPFRDGSAGTGSCFRRQCDGVGNCVQTARADICEAEVQEPGCGTLVCTGSGGSDSPVARRGGPNGEYAGIVIGCGRTDRCLVDVGQTGFTFCAEPGFQLDPYSCQQCDPSAGDDMRGALPDGSRCGFDPLDRDCSACLSRSCVERDPIPEECLL
jgi:hypothetical protein